LVPNATELPVVPVCDTDPSSSFALAPGRDSRNESPSRTGLSASTRLPDFGIFWQRKRLDAGPVGWVKRPPHPEAQPTVSEWGGRIVRQRDHDGDREKGGFRFAAPTLREPEAPIWHLKS
jgi:hypothetical protein